MKAARSPRIARGGKRRRAAGSGPRPPEGADPQEERSDGTEHDRRPLSVSDRSGLSGVGITEGRRKRSSARDGSDRNRYTLASTRRTRDDPVVASRPIYLDYQATTPVDSSVMSAMLPYFTEVFGNPHSDEHWYGQQAADAIKAARFEVARLVGASANEVVFTSGATEANNLVISAAANAARRAGRGHLITCTTEHKAVLQVFERLGKAGFEVTIVPVRPDGILELRTLEAAIRPDTGLVSIMAVNNEIGVIQPIHGIAEMCRRQGVLFHTDAAQAAGKIALDMEASGIGFLTLSGHKLYGPKGIGAAVIRRDTKLRLEPIMVGGGQEGGLRPGTLPTPLCVGLGAACRLAARLMRKEADHLTMLRDQFLARLDQANVVYSVNGSRTSRIPGNLNLSFHGVDAEALLMTLRDQVAIASGSACTSRSLEPSHVLEALQMSPEQAESAVRVGFGRTTTSLEVDMASHQIGAAVTALRAISTTKVPA
jgi:cysteine desulfurase